LRFRPSPESYTPAQRTLALLRYIHKATEAIETHIEMGGEIPAWALDKIHRAAASIGMAVSFTTHVAEKTTRPQPPHNRKKKALK
jgi:hypothetical protein